MTTSVLESRCEGHRFPFEGHTVDLYEGCSFV